MLLAVTMCLTDAGVSEYSGRQVLGSCVQWEPTGSRCELLNMQVSSRCKGASLDGVRSDVLPPCCTVPPARLLDLNKLLIDVVKTGRCQGWHLTDAGKHTESHPRSTSPVADVSLHRMDLSRCRQAKVLLNTDSRTRLNASHVLFTTSIVPVQ